MNIILTGFMGRGRQASGSGVYLMVVDIHHDMWYDYA